MFFVNYPVAVLNTKSEISNKLQNAFENMTSCPISILNRGEVPRLGEGNEINQRQMSFYGHLCEI